MQLAVGVLAGLTIALLLCAVLLVLRVFLGSLELAFRGAVWVLYGICSACLAGLGWVGHWLARTVRRLRI